MEFERTRKARGPPASRGEPQRRTRRKSMKILAVGDSYMPPRYFEQVFASLEARTRSSTSRSTTARPFTPTTPSEQKLKEYQGSPDRTRREDGRRRGARRPGGARDRRRPRCVRRAEAGGLRPRRPGEHRRRRRERARVAPRQHARQERRGRRRPDARLSRHARPGLPKGTALPRRGKSAEGQLGGREVHRAATCAATSSASSGTGRSATASRTAPSRSG